MNRFRLIALLLPLVCFAAASEASRTPAGTVIRNQAKVTYERDDDTGRVFEASSNEVLIEVLPIYGIEISPDHSDPFDAPGNEAQLQYAASAVSFGDRQQVTLQYILTFTGNVPDTATISPLFAHAESDFLPQLADGDTGFLIYRDANGNGVIDSGDVLVASWRDANLDGVLDPAEISVTTLGLNYQPNETESLLVTFFVPTGVAAGSKAFIGLRGESAGDPSQIDQNNFSLVEVFDGPVIALTKSANASTVAPGGSLEYTVTAVNVGSEDTVGREITVDGDAYVGALVVDRVPIDSVTGEPLPLGSALVDNGSNVSGTFIYTSRSLSSATENPEDPSFDPTGPDWNWTATYDPDPAEPYTLVGFVTSEGGGSDFDITPVAGSNTVSFRLEVSVPVETKGQTLLNKAFAHYGYGASWFTITSRNQILTPVGGQYGVIIRDTDYLADPPVLTPADDFGGISNNEQIRPMAEPGRAVYFVNRVVNSGGLRDTFNIVVDPASDIPAGWNVVLLKTDGLTPLVDTGRDGIPDTGELEPATDVNDPQKGAFFDVVVRVDIPEKSVSSGDVPMATIVLKATSLGNSNESDTTFNFVNDLGELLMDLENNVDVPGDPVNKLPVTESVDAGSFVDFPLIVRNQAPSDGETDVYVLTAPGLPPGWSVQFFRDLDGNGVLDPGEDSRPFNHTLPVEPQADTYMIARVFVPEGFPADSDYVGNPLTNDPFPVIFRATSSHQPVCNDPATDNTCAEITNFVTVSYFNRFHIEADRVGVIEAGSVTEYTHTVRNFSDRSNRFYIKVSAGSPEWQWVLLVDDDSGTALPAEVAPDAESYGYLDIDRRVVAGQASEATFRIRLFAPASAPQGSTDVTTIQVLAWDPADSNIQWDVEEKHFVVDITTVVSGDLRLTKSSSAPYSQHIPPGDEITYTTVFFNRSAGPLTDVVIIDAVSPHTTYKRESGSVQFTDALNPPNATFEISTDGGVSYSADVAGPDVPRVTNVRIVLDGPLEAGSKGEYQFTVTVR